jgi:hypothetical protein
MIQNQADKVKERIERVKKGAAADKFDQKSTFYTVTYY